MLSVRALRRVQRLIEFRDLHAMVPVPIRQLAQEEGWIVQFRERIHPLYGYAIIQGQTRLMTVAAGITPQAQRYVMAHEYAHGLLGDAGVLHLCGDPDALWRREEEAVDQLAARLLIPRRVLEEVQMVAEVAAACEVPESLVRIRVGEV